MYQQLGLLAISTGKGAAKATLPATLQAFGASFHV